MSKSIYEEALKHLNILNDFVINWCDEIDLDYHDTYKNNYQKVIKALEKAQKQEKLLELYKELSKLKDDVIHLVMFGKDYEHLRVKTVKNEQQIKELENDK